MGEIGPFILVAVLLVFGAISWGHRKLRQVRNRKFAEAGLALRLQQDREDLRIKRERQERQAVARKVWEESSEGKAEIARRVAARAETDRQQKERIEKQYTLAIATEEREQAVKKAKEEAKRAREDALLAREQKRKAKEAQQALEIATETLFEEQMRVKSGDYKKNRKKVSMPVEAERKQLTPEQIRAEREEWQKWRAARGTKSQKWRDLAETGRIFDPSYNPFNKEEVPTPEIMIKSFKDLVMQNRERALVEVGTYGLPNDGRMIEGKIGSDTPRPYQFIRAVLEEQDGRELKYEVFDNREDFRNAVNGKLFLNVWDYLLSYYQGYEFLFQEAKSRWRKYRGLIDEL